MNDWVRRAWRRGAHRRGGLRPECVVAGLRRRATRATLTIPARRVYCFAPSLDLGFVFGIKSVHEAPRLAVVRVGRIRGIGRRRARVITYRVFVSRMAKPRATSAASMLYKALSPPYLTEWRYPDRRSPPAARPRPDARPHPQQILANDVNQRRPPLRDLWARVPQVVRGLGAVFK